MTCSFVALLSLLVFTSSPVAAPLDRTNLPAAVDTCLHFDCDLIREFDWLRSSQNYLLSHPEIRRHLDGLPEQLRFITGTCLHDLTFYRRLSSFADDSKCGWCTISARRRARPRRPKI
jgi:hypothetical protein